MIPKHAIQTASGKYVDLTAPRTAEFTIEDLAHALARVCRFTGHCREFYSVAQHSVLVSRLVPHDMALTALLHDAQEAFLGDVSSPLKSLLPDYKFLERSWEKEIARRFGTHYPQPPVIKEADITALVTEKRDLLPGNDRWPGYEKYPVLPQRIQPLQPAQAERLFLIRYHDILRVTEIAV